MKKYFWAVLVSLFIVNSCNDNSVDPVFDKPIIEIKTSGGCFMDSDILVGKITLVPYLKGQYRAEFSGVVLKAKMPEDTLECFYKIDWSDSCLVKKNVKFYFNVKESVEINRIANELKEWHPKLRDISRMRLCHFIDYTLMQNRVIMINYMELDEKYKEYISLKSLINDSIYFHLKKN